MEMSWCGWGTRVPSISLFSWLKRAMRIDHLLMNFLNPPLLAG